MKMKQKKAFTLVELLVVISIIGMLAALLLPAVQAAREAGRRAVCISNQKNLGLALQNYASSKGKLPQLVNKIGDNGQTGNNKVNYYGSWLAVLLPYLEKNDVWEELRVGNHTGTTQRAQDIRNSSIDVLACPSNSEAGTDSAKNLCYRANCGRHGMIDANQYIDSQYCGVFDMKGMSIDSIPDGSSSTIMLAEAVLPSSWSNGWNYNPNYYSPAYATTAASGTTGHVMVENNNLSIDLEKKLGFVVPQEETSSSVPPLKINQDLDPSTTSSSGNMGSQHPGIVVVTFCGGQTQTLSDGIDIGVYLHLITPNSRRARNLGIDNDHNWPYYGNTTYTKFFKPLDEADF